MPVNVSGLAIGLALAQRRLPSGSAISAALPAGVIPNTALGIAVTELVIQQQATNRPPTGGVVIPVSAPAVTGVSPNAGPLTGGTTVTITGDGLDGATAVNFGTTAASPFTVNPDGSITVTSPAENAATVDVTVTGPGGTSAVSAADQFTFMAPPTVTGISPASGWQSGQTQVTVSGTDLAGASAVMFGPTPGGSPQTNQDGSITTTSPPQLGTAIVDVIVTAPGGTSQPSAVDQFTYAAAPTVTKLTPARGQGGTKVTVAGTDLAGATGVSFGPTAAQVIKASATEVVAIAPYPSRAGAVDVTVTTPGGISATVEADKFTFVEHKAD